MREEPFDLEEALADAGRTPLSQERLWELSAQVALLILDALPGGRIQCGGQLVGVAPVDYVTPRPSPPLKVFGPDGRFIVGFDAQGFWVDAQGNRRSFAGVVEGGPESIARSLVRSAGLDVRSDGARGVRRDRLAHSDGLPRMLVPRPTCTWRDEFPYPQSPRWASDEAASICLPGRHSRLVVARYDPQSCTYSPDVRPSRWGMESLRIPRLGGDRRGGGIGVREVGPGDCLATWGPKQEDPGDVFAECDADADADVIWHPQRVVHAEVEGRGHLRVWLVVDHEVANLSARASDLGLPAGEACHAPIVAEASLRQVILEAFALDDSGPSPASEPRTSAGGVGQASAGRMARKEDGSA